MWQLSGWRSWAPGAAFTAGLVFGSGAALLALSGGGNASDPPPPPAGHAVEVPVAVVVKRTVPIFRDYVGTTEAIRSIALQAQVTGYLVKQAAADGADVAEGALLYRIDPRSYQAALDQAEAQTQRDDAALRYAAANHRRNEAMRKAGSVSLDTLQQSASSEYQASAAVAADRAAIETAQLNLAYTELRAPFAGRLGISRVYEGSLITTAGTQINTLVKLDPIYATFNPPATDLPEILARQAQAAIPAEVTAGGAAGTPYRGALTVLDNSVDRGTGTITARATIPNPARRLLPGQFVHVRLHLADRPDTLLVPQVAVGTSLLGKYLFVVGPDDKIEQRQVTLGAVYGPLVAIGKGVTEGERVVVGNLLKIGPGTPVKPIPPPPSPPAMNSRDVR